MYKPHLLQPLIHAQGIAGHVDAVIIGDLIKEETGKSAQEYIRCQLTSSCGLSMAG